jgi:hypothetical protein
MFFFIKILSNIKKQIENNNGLENSKEHPIIQIQLMIVTTFSTMAFA